MSSPVESHRILSRATRMLRDEGLRGVVNRLYSRHRAIYFEKPLDTAVASVTSRTDLHLEFDRVAEVIDWMKAQPVDGTWSARELASMERRGQLIGGLYMGHELVGYTKLGWSRVYIMDYQCDLDLPEGDCMVLDSYIAPGRRGQGLGNFLVAESSREMAIRGFERRLSFVRADNVPMLRVAARAGYRRLGQVDFYIILRRKVFRPHPLDLIDAAGSQR